MKKILSIFLLIFIQHNCFSQTLDKKWNSIIDKSNSYNAHKIIRVEELNGIWNSVQDSLMIMRINVKQEQKKVVNQASEIGSLNLKIKTLNDRYSVAEQERDKAIDRADSKGTYIMSLWIGMGIVSLICAVLYVLYTKSNALTMQKTTDYDQLLKSFEDYKTGKLEVERKLKREIQTYMNTVEEMKTRRV